jgi:putative lipoprotein
MRALPPIPAAILLASLVIPRPARAQEGDPWFARDKALHFGASAGLTLTGYTATALATPDPGHRLGVASALALGAGIGKEIADRYTGGDPSLRDLTWDVLGTASGLLVAWLIDHLVF